VLWLRVKSFKGRLPERVNYFIPGNHKSSAFADLQRRHRVFDRPIHVRLSMRLYGCTVQIRFKPLTPKCLKHSQLDTNVHSICLYYQIRFTIVKRVNSSSGMTFRLPLLPPLPFAPVS
jgi:hypothetical protein